MAGDRLRTALSSAPAVAVTKTLLTVFNFIFWITGIAILALGIWTKVQLYMYMELSTVYYKEAPYIMIAVGAGVVIVGSFGCFCTVKGHAMLLYMYSVFLVVVFIVELSTGAAGFVYKNKLQKGFSTGLTSALSEYGFSDKSTNAFNGLQHGLHCCGKDSYTDWFTAPWEKSQTSENVTNVVPKSCCRGNQNKCVNINLPTVVEANKTLDVYTNGCYKRVTSFMGDNMAVIGGVALGISFFQLLGAALACCLAKSVNRSRYEQVE